VAHLAHDPEKWRPVFGKDHAQKEISADFAVLKRRRLTIAFSSEVDAGSREENALKQKNSASVLMQSGPNMR
jgi:hypothetical protein